MPRKTTMKLMALVVSVVCVVCGRPSRCLSPHQISPAADPANDPRRPIWNIAHMVNSIKELDYRLGKGANAVEADVVFDVSGFPLYTYHGAPCDCWRHCHQREALSDYLQYVRDISLDDKPMNSLGSNLTLLLLDLKLDYLKPSAKVTAGRQLAQAVVDDLFYEPQTLSSAIDQSLETNEPQSDRKLANHHLKLVVSINHINDLELVLNFMHYIDTSNTSDALASRIGFDVGMNDELSLIERMWSKIDARPLNVWQGDGWTNCISPFYNLERLTTALAKRDSHRKPGYIQKVYQWTIDLHDRLREALRLGVDAVMTNHPERLASVAQEPELAQLVRLADRDDDPFKRFVPQAKPRSVQSARENKSKPVYSGILGGIFDVLSSWFAYVREIPFLSFPSTSRFLARRTKVQLAPAQKKSSPEFTRYSTSTIDATNDTIIEGAKLKSAVRTSTSETPPIKLNDETESSSSTQNPTLNANENIVDTQQAPKWYTSLLTGFLLGLLRVALPPPDSH